MAGVNSEEYGDNEIVAYYHDEYGDYVLTGVVMDKPAGTGSVYVKFDDNDWDYDEEEVDCKLLVLESDLDQIEVEFKAVSEEIKKKMKEAAKLVNEAGKLAKKARAGSLESMYDAVGPLVSAMDNNGWRSSSWNC